MSGWHVPFVQSPAGDKAAVSQVQTEANKLPPMQNWNIVVVDKQGWEDMNRERGTKMLDEHPTDKAFSMLPNHRTYINGEWLKGKAPDQVAEVLSHEYGHLSMQSMKESDANKFSHDWMKRRPK